MGLIPRWGRSPEEGNGNPLHYSCLQNPVDRGAGSQKSWTLLGDWTTTEERNVQETCLKCTISFFWILAFWRSQLTWEDLLSKTSFHSSEFLRPHGQQNLSWLVPWITICLFPFCYTVSRGFFDDSDGKESSCNVGDRGSIPRLGWSPGEGVGYPLQYSCLENSMDRGAWWTAVRGVTESEHWTTNIHTHIHVF